MTYNVSSRTLNPAFQTPGSRACVPALTSGGSSDAVREPPKPLLSPQGPTCLSHVKGVLLW